jgi:hypothetical protein
VAEPAERIAAALEAIAHSLSVGVELQRDKRRRAAKVRRQHRPPAGPPPDDLAKQLAKQALRRIGR